MQGNKNDSTVKMPTLLDKTNEAVKDGFTESFTVKSNALTSLEGSKKYNPAEVSIVSFHRFEGYSDPEDNAILYLIETADGRRGTLTDAYGPYADPAVSKFIAKVEDIHKAEAQPSES